MLQTGQSFGTQGPLTQRGIGISLDARNPSILGIDEYTAPSVAHPAAASIDFFRLFNYHFYLCSLFFR